MQRAEHAKISVLQLFFAWSWHQFHHAAARMKTKYSASAIAAATAASGSPPGA